jgi:putative tryptophan/tyrosine transport system substrate-binding protein
MRRREFIAGLGGAAAWSVAARAQQPGQMKRVGVLMGVANNAFGQGYAKGFQQELQRLGWTDGRNVAIEYRWGEGRIERLAEFAAEFVRLKADVIVTASTPSTASAKEATSVIPIVMVGNGDPIGTGLIASLARPGGNVTGMTVQGTDLGGKRLELLRELVPGLRRLAILVNADNVASVLEMHEVEAAAGALGLEVIRLEIRRAEDIASAFKALKGPFALYVVQDPLMIDNALRINTLALGARLPTMHGNREQLEAGGLVFYGVDIRDLYRRSAVYVDKILRGAKPADIPVEQPTKFDLVINLKTAKALGLTIPETLLATADEVIQ